MDLVLLTEKIKESGITMTALSEKSSISRETLYNRLAGKGEFKASEIVSLTNALRLSRIERDQIFFNEESE